MGREPVILRFEELTSSTATKPLRSSATTQIVKVLYVIVWGVARFLRSFAVRNPDVFHLGGASQVLVPLSLPVIEPIASFSQIDPGRFQVSGRISLDFRA